MATDTTPRGETVEQELDAALARIVRALNLTIAQAGTLDVFVKRFNRPETTQALLINIGPGLAAAAACVLSHDQLLKGAAAAANLCLQHPDICDHCAEAAQQIIDTVFPGRDTDGDTPANGIVH